MELENKRNKFEKVNQDKALYNKKIYKVHWTFRDIKDNEII